MADEPVKAATLNEFISRSASDIAHQLVIAIVKKYIKQEYDDEDHCTVLTLDAIAIPLEEYNRLLQDAYLHGLKDGRSQSCAVFASPSASPLH